MYYDLKEKNNNLERNIDCLKLRIKSLENERKNEALKKENDVKLLNNINDALNELSGLFSEIKCVINDKEKK